MSIPVSQFIFPSSLFVKDTSAFICPRVPHTSHFQNLFFLCDSPSQCMYQIRIHPWLLLLPHLHVWEMRSESSVLVIFTTKYLLRLSASHYDHHQHPISHQQHHSPACPHGRAWKGGILIFQLLLQLGMAVSLISDQWGTPGDGRRLQKVQKDIVFLTEITEVLAFVPWCLSATLNEHIISRAGAIILQLIGRSLESTEMGSFLNH